MSSLSPRLALRIGLAARAMPSVTPARLVNVLVEALKLPLTDQKLKRLSMDRLRSAAGSDLAEIPLAQLETALGYLWDRIPIDIIESAKPKETQPRQDLQPGSVRVAVASNSVHSLDGDFSDCKRFLVFDVSSAGIRQVATRGTEGGRIVKDRNTWRTDLIGDCRIVLVAGIGIRGHSHLVNRGVYVVRNLQPEPLDEVLGELQRVLREGPPPWLAKLTCSPAVNPVLPSQLASALLHFAARSAA